VSPEKHREIENEAHTFLTGLSLSEEEASANELEREESPPGDANRGVVMREESPHGEEDGIRGDNEEREGKQRGSNEGRGESGAGKGATRPTIMVSGGTLVVQVTSAPTMDSEEAEARRVAMKRRLLERQAERTRAWEVAKELVQQRKLAKREALLVPKPDPKPNPNPAS